MTQLPGPPQRGRSRNRAESDLRDRTPVDVDDLAAAAELEVDEPPARRTVAQFAIASVVCAVVLVLFVLFASQWTRSAVIDFGGRIPCAGPQCVEVPLARLEGGSGVTFPVGTIVERSSRSKSMFNNWSVGFEVRLPAGSPVPDAPQPWLREPDPETGIPLYVRNLMEQGLEDVRWTDGLWVAGVDRDGSTIVLGNYRVGP